MMKTGQNIRFYLMKSTKAETSNCIISKNSPHPSQTGKTFNDTNETVCFTLGGLPVSEDADLVG